MNVCSYIACFNFNFLSVDKLIDNLSCVLTFDYNGCHIQDNNSLKIIGSAKMQDRLYILKSQLFLSVDFLAGWLEWKALLLTCLLRILFYVFSLHWKVARLGQKGFYHTLTIKSVRAYENNISIKFQSSM